MMIEATVQGIDLRFETAAGLFSPQSIDEGTLALVSGVLFEKNDKVLDLGCGYGAMGIYAAKRLSPPQVFMIDKDTHALECAARNARINGVEGVHIELSDGFRDFHEIGFTKILCNPPYHTDFSVAKHFIEKGFNRLVVGGAMLMVTKRDKWYRNKLTSVFGGARVTQHGSYFVFESVKKSATYAHQTRRQP
jgi:16S rRNA (guanine1207-N2)-methyltransferase